ncbi:ABC transporter ATP-binding protein [Paeniglutamicibacter sp. ZC-3]|uniref:ABC transporter ATP-binding protein n=1 Tax=Paeniglutamicibacter sp. ZC-3 TaxID=2986919 RepID=UPI0021F76D83|nr:ABC transporter ATP-binding protein [Paeniglutamicibacter sp. ZC-3]MCV9994150.1 ABC transporter ATP-binding protein [Paeniglutamicibacter sp. ZC-3]
MSMQISGIGASHVPGKPVLRDISLTVEPGEMLAVLGPSGSGKSTLLRVIAGLHPADSGTIRLNGRDITSLRPEARRIGLVPQDGALFPHLTVAANIAYGIRGPRTRKAAAAHPRVRELLALVRLEDLADRMPHQLSGGQQQRVALARALAPRPDLVLLDEPFSALDAALRQQVREEVTEVLARSGVATILITHDQAEALSLGAHVALLHDGRVVQTGTPHDIYARPCDRWVAEFVGAANFLTGVPEDAGVRTVLGLLSMEESYAGNEPRVHVMVRPEQLQLQDAQLAEGLAGQVISQQYFGHDQLTQVQLAGSNGAPGPTLICRTNRIYQASDRITVSAQGPFHMIG